MASIFRAYQRQIANHPFRTGAITSGFLFGMGDVIAQQGIEKKGIHHHNFAATARMAAYGSCVFGPAAVGWYKVLEKYIVIKNRPNIEMISRVAADQLIFAPIGIAVFFASMATMEGIDPQEKLAESWWVALRANWNVWPAVQLVNFRFVPLEMRVLFANVISVGWNSYLSWLNSLQSNKKASPSLEPEVIAPEKKNAIKSVPVVAKEEV
ncbi:hypothetical protein BZA77DRAFT_386160 [Pyronema omphalodes]|nr:hypothetical protein BZA77DRAFT_386160 [Pyronema omphalodes]